MVKKALCVRQECIKEEYWLLVCRYHVYREIWEAANDEALLCVVEQVTFTTGTLWLLKRTGKLLDIGHEKC